MARRQAEILLKDDPLFYVTSLTSQVVVYQGLVMPADLPAFLDLQDERLMSHIVVFHQRFLYQHATKMVVSAAVSLSC